ncbi:hypothetical protein ACGFNY_44230 [Streptomyces chartreusis]|uniref:hypothetical protein n=1 Tax=Streptomyces chartreusis TaxID=1969 RepID=UPI00371F0039
MPDFLSEPQRWAIPAVLIVSVAGVVVNLWWERRRPTSYTRRPDFLAEWRSMSAAEQEEVDNASLDLAEQAEIDARQDAVEAAEHLLERRAVVNAQFHP